MVLGLLVHWLGTLRYGIISRIIVGYVAVMTNCARGLSTLVVCFMDRDGRWLT